ncbi:MAG: hypothetical protein EON59_03130 [Alphaproteobacteria bacterium]|nr:MAG: hypothetical protein EON59_03130 [Alphaproteobacteria bacterium]
MSAGWLGKVVVKAQPGGQRFIEGRIICVDEVDDLICVIPMPRIKKNGHVDNYVPSPKLLSAKAFATRLADESGLQLLEFTSPAHWLWTDAQLQQELGDGTGKRRRYKLHTWRERERQAFELIKPLVDKRSLEQIAFDPEYPGRIREQADALSCSPVRIRRAINAYLLGMGNRRALLPWYGRCGGPGRQRFSKTETGRPSIGAVRGGEKRPFSSVPPYIRKILELGWRRFKKPAVSAKLALTRTLNEYLAESVEWDGPRCKVKLSPAASAITVAMFRYWGTRNPGSLRASEIERGETRARREYLRRIGKMRGRLETVNGVAFIDSTSTDQTLVSAASPVKILRAPWRTEVLGGCIDYIFGIHVGFESPSATTALLAILSAATDKVAFCSRYGHEIQPRDWYASAFASFLMDNGEGKGSLALRQIEEMESSASFGAAYDAINKAPSESGHHKRQKALDHTLPGSTLGRRKRRGEPDRSEFARLRFDDYMHELIGEILHHNNVAYVDPLKIEMYDGLKERTRRGILEWLMSHHYVSSAAVDLDVLKVRCLPRLRAVMHGDGLHLFDPSRRERALVPELVYRSDWLFAGGQLQEARRRSWYLEAHLDPSNLSQVWVNIDGLRRLELCCNDPELQRLCLLDWLTICSDNRLAGYLARVHETQHNVNQAASIKAAVKAGNVRLREAEKQLGKKPTKTALKAGRNENTVIEAAVMSGLPRPLPTATSISRADQPRVVEAARPAASDIDPLDDLLKLAAALYDDGQ